MNKNLLAFIGVMFALVALAFALSVDAAEITCEQGFHVETILVDEGVVGVDEVSHIVHHDAVTHEETVVVTEAWDEYKNVGHFKGDYIKIGDKYKYLGHNLGNYDLIHHDEVTEVITVTDIEAWDEKVIDVEGVGSVPPTYEDTCVADPIVEKKFTGGGNCLNCEDPVEEEEEEVVEEEVVEEEEVAGSTCPALLKSYIQLGADNSIVDVAILQSFLNDHMDAGLTITGTYDLATFEAVKAFQTKYYDKVITPWHVYIPTMGATGYVFQTTKWMINKILCEAEAGEFPVLEV